MTYQTNPCFEHVDNLEGCCLFASAHAILDLCEALDQFTDDNMLAWLSKAKTLGDIIADDFLQFPQAWSDIITGVPGKVLYLDRILPTGFSEQGVATLDYLFNPDTQFHHFVREWLKGGHCYYDPINYGGQGSNTARGPNTYVESCRGYQLA